MNTQPNNNNNNSGTNNNKNMVVPYIQGLGEIQRDKQQ